MTSCSRRGRAPVALGLLGLMAAVGGVGCVPSKRTLHITSDPMGVFVKANQKNLGLTPLQYEYDDALTPTFTISGEKEGYFSESVIVSPTSPYVLQGQIRLALRENPIWRETVSSNATNVWLRVQIQQDITAEDVWQKIVDSVTTAFDSLEQLDPLSGYLRSASRERRWDIGDPKGAFLVRTQFIGSLSSKDPLIYKLKIKSDFRWDSWREWQPYERVFKEDAELIEELGGRLGIK